MLEFARLKQNRRKFLALTGLTLKEFNALLPAFTAGLCAQVSPRQNRAWGQAKTPAGWWASKRTEHHGTEIAVYLGDSDTT